MTAPIKRIKQYLCDHDVSSPQILLICGGQFSNAVGDTVTFAHHWRYTRHLFDGCGFAVWTADEELWKVLCGHQVECTPFCSRRTLTEKDIVIFDWVPVGRAAEALFDGSDAVLIEFEHTGRSVRYRLGAGAWEVVSSAPIANNVRRVDQGYQSLGVETLHIPPTRSSQRGCEGEKSIVYLNPFGSNAIKCMEKGVFEALVDTFGWCANTQILCPKVTAMATNGDPMVYEELNAIVSHYASSGMVTQLPAMSTGEYVTTLGGADVVIGTDTSSQHVAHYFGVPTITCYPHHTGYRYFFWGCPGERNLCLRAPTSASAGQHTHFARLVVRLAMGLLYGTRTAPSGCSDCEEFSESCSRIVLGALSATTGRANLDRSLESIRKSIPSEWHEFLIPELQTVADEVCRDEHGQPAIALDRVRELFAAKAVRTIRAAALSDRRAVLNAVVSSVGEGSAGEGCSL